MEYVEINEEKQTIRKFKGAENSEEAIRHVLSFNRIHILSIESIEDIKGSIDQFCKDLGVDDFKRTGLFEKEREEKP